MQLLILFSCLFVSAWGLPTIDLSSTFDAVQGARSFPSWNDFPRHRPPTFIPNSITTADQVSQGLVGNNGLGVIDGSADAVNTDGGIAQSSQHSSGAGGHGSTLIVNGKASSTSTNNNNRYNPYGGLPY